jgi:hypothetical protein
MKTPDDIKKGLRNAKHVQCMDISDGENESAGARYGVLVGYVLRDKIYTYITQLEADNDSKQKRIEELESQLAQTKRERDAEADCIQKVYSELVKPAETFTAIRLNVTYAMYAMIAYFRRWPVVCPENTKEE